MRKVYREFIDTAAGALTASEPATGSILSARPMISSADDTPGTETRRPRSEVAGARRCPPVEATAANRCFAGRFRAATATLWSLDARARWLAVAAPAAQRHDPESPPRGKISSALGGQWARVVGCPVAGGSAPASYRPPHLTLTTLDARTRRHACSRAHRSCRLLRNKMG